MLVFPDKEEFLDLMEQRVAEEILDLLDLRAMLENKEREANRVLLVRLVLQERLAVLVILDLLDLRVKQEQLE